MWTTSIGYVSTKSARCLLYPYSEQDLWWLPLGQHQPDQRSVIMDGVVTKVGDIDFSAGNVLRCGLGLSILFD